MGCVRGDVWTFAIAGFLAGAPAAHAGSKGVPAPANARVEISLRMSGDVHVEAWARDEIRVTTSDEGVPAVRVKGRNVIIEPEAPFGDGDLKLQLPAKAEVSVHTLSGSVVVKGMTGEVSVRCVSGDVRVFGSTGRVRAASVSGNVRVEGNAHDADVRSVSGDVDVIGATGTIAGRSVSGAVRLKDIVGARVTAKSTSGDIRFHGTVAADGALSAQSFSGNVSVRLRQGDFEVRARSRSGSVTLAGFTPHDAEVQANAARGRAGKGGARVKARSFSGNITIAAESK